MREEENIVEYLQRVDEIVKEVRGLRVKVYYKIIVQEVSRSLPLRYDAKISAIEDKENIDKLTMDELHVIPIAYEMRIGQEKPSRREEDFKASKETNNHDQTLNEIPSMKHVRKRQIW